MAELELKERRRLAKRESDRKNRMFWFFTGYIQALEANGLDASKYKEDARQYGYCD